MLSKIEELFDYLNRGDLEKLRSNLRTDLVNTYSVYTIRDYDQSYSRRHPLLRSEIQHTLLLFKAMLLESYEAFEMLLGFGANLLLRETFDRTTHEETPAGVIIPHREFLVTDIALVCVSKSKNLRFIQMTFDHICTHGLAEPVYIDFLLKHFQKVNRDKFTVKCLKIDVGNPLPRKFDDTEEYRAFLVDNDVDITGLFFLKSEYLDYLRNPNSVDKAFLEHALRVCEFTFEELQQIYSSLPEGPLRQTVEEHSPEVNPDFLVAINALCTQVEEVEAEKALHKKPRVSDPKIPKSVPGPVQITSVHLQELAHLEKRIAFLERTIERLDENPKKNKKQLELERSSLRDCRKRFLQNPAYQASVLNKAEEHSDPKKDNGPPGL